MKRRDFFKTLVVTPPAFWLAIKKWRRINSITIADLKGTKAPFVCEDGMYLFGEKDES